LTCKKCHLFQPFGAQPKGCAKSTTCKHANRKVEFGKRRLCDGSDAIPSDVTEVVRKKAININKNNNLSRSASHSERAHSRVPAQRGRDIPSSLPAKQGPALTKQRKKKIGSKIADTLNGAAILKEFDEAERTAVLEFKTAYEDFVKERTGSEKFFVVLQKAKVTAFLTGAMAADAAGVSYAKFLEAADKSTKNWQARESVSVIQPWMISSCVEEVMVKLSSAPAKKPAKGQRVAGQDYGLKHAELPRKLAKAGFAARGAAEYRYIESVCLTLARTPGASFDEKYKGEIEWVMENLLPGWKS